MITINIFTIEDLRLAWERVIASVGSDAKDYFGISVYKTNLNKHLTELNALLNDGKFLPSRPFKYYEPKKGGTQRTKTVLCISDAIIYQAIANKIALKVYEHLNETKHYVFGSVLNENIVKGTTLLNEDEPDFYFFEYYVILYNRFVEGINNTLNTEEINYRLETDITGFFDCIPHSTLILKLNELGIQEDILEILATCLNVWSGTRERATYQVGIPQGPAASFLLANLMLDDLDRLVIKQGLNYYRFMDDIRIYGTSEKELKTILVSIDAHLKGLGLSINGNKTSILSTSDASDERERLLDSSGIPTEIKTEDYTEVDIDVETLIQDQTQLNESTSGGKVLSKEEALSQYFNKIDLIEIDLLVKKRRLKRKISNNTISSKDIRGFLTLSQKWRVTVKAINSIQDYSPNQELIKIWLFGIEHFFWKANSMVWNFKLYDDLSPFSKEIEKVLNDFTHFEWVQYQLISILDKVIQGNKPLQKRAFDNLRESNSPLVRLGYYSILIEAIKTDSQLFDSLSVLLKEENESYVKESVLNMIHKRHLNISLDHLKNWFL